MPTESLDRPALTAGVSERLWRALSAYVDDEPFEDAELDDCINLRQICDVLSDRAVSDILESRR